MGAAAELRLHADHEVEQLLPLNHLGHRLASDGRRYHCFYVRDVDAIARNLVAVDIHQQAGLAQFAHDGEFGESGHLRQNVLDLDRLVLKNIQIVAVDFDRKRTLQTSQGLVDGVFRRLRVVENDSREGGEFLVDGLDQFRLCC